MQVFSENMGTKSEPQITKCKQGENWTRVTFKPDLAKFNMTNLEDDVVALMRKRVVDMAGTLGKTVKVELDGQRVPIKNFGDYVNLYMKTANSDRPDKLPKFVLILHIHNFLVMLIYKIFCWLYLIISHLVYFFRTYEQVNDRWEVCVTLSEGQFQQVISVYVLCGSSFLCCGDTCILKTCSTTAGQLCKQNCNHKGWNSC